jgi:serine/threonine-protein kinase RsbW
MTEPARLCIRAELSALAAVRDFINATGLALGALPDALTDLVLAADEAVTNIIMHGYRGADKLIEIEMAREHDDLIVRIYDEAPVYDPTTQPPPDLSIPLEERSIGGLGIHIMRSCCDEVEHKCRPGGGNVLVLIKRLV